MIATDPLGLDCAYLGDDGNAYILTGDCDNVNDNGYHVDRTITGVTLSDGQLGIYYNPTDPSDPLSTGYNFQKDPYLYSTGAPYFTGYDSSSARNYSISAANTATISAYHPSVSTCLGQAAISAGEDLLGVSMLPGSDQDNWQWSSDKFGFVYTGAAEADSLSGVSNGVDIVGRMSRLRCGHARGTGNNPTILEERRGQGLHEARVKGRYFVRKVGGQGGQGSCRLQCLREVSKMPRKLKKNCRQRRYLRLDRPCARVRRCNYPRQGQRTAQMACGDHVDVLCAVRGCNIWSEKAWFVAVLDFLGSMFGSARVRDVGDLRADFCRVSFWARCMSVPLAFLEAILLIGIFSKLERGLAAIHSGHASGE